MSTLLGWRLMKRRLKRLKRKNLKWLPLVLITLLFWIQIVASLILQPNPTQKTDYPELSGMIILQGNSLVGVSNSNLPESFSPKVLASFGDEKVKVLIQNSYQKLYNLAFCESSFRPEVCSYAGCHSGIGLVGIIPSTWNSTLVKMEKAGSSLPDSCKIPVTNQDLERFKLGDRNHPIFIPECNLKVGLWLLENEGIHHWNSSYRCWSKLNSVNYSTPQ